MSLHTLQNALFKIYLNPGYRLAHQFDPDRFAARFGLGEEYATIVRCLPSEEVEDFARELKAKQMSNLRLQLPMAYGWLAENRPEVLREFEEISTLSRLAGRGALADLFVTYIREWRDYSDLPDALPEVARLEHLLMSVRRDQEEAQRRWAKTAVTGVRPARFTWDSLYWTRPSTSVAHFEVDALSVLLKKRAMRDPGQSVWVVIAPAVSGQVPTVMRIAEPAYAVLSSMEEPIRARDLLEKTVSEDVEIDDRSLRSLLDTLESIHVVGAYHKADHDGR
ncbi:MULTISPECIES: hypothetical protein [unclassified Streptomyces]|uniref:hypothetical protein n=1 Tax=unclassified Streptomyces TaxID=2593676 RepID=UPI0004C4B00C|nr:MULTISPECIES: hypothetical protein [unclassified Streptomyces]KOV76241.1 hypothetical protein ADL02_31440 [Streptomyces sp. NRRL WC-3723]